VGELIRRTLSEILAGGELHDPGLEGVLVTVGEVRVSPDLKQATAFVLPLGGADGPALLEALARARPGLRHLLGRAMTLRHVPDLRFRLDDTFDRIDATRRLFEDERVRRDLDAPAPDAEPEGERRDGPEDAEGGEPGAGPEDGAREPDGEGGAR
jgi:ribosome-binding factor A